MHADATQLLQHRVKWAVFGIRSVHGYLDKHMCVEPEKACTYAHAHIRAHPHAFMYICISDCCSEKRSNVCFSIFQLKNTYSRSLKLCPLHDDSYALH